MFFVAGVSADKIRLSPVSLQCTVSFYDPGTSLTLVSAYALWAPSYSTNLGSSKDWTWPIYPYDGSDIYYGIYGNFFCLARDFLPSLII